ncbi:MAG: hydroxymethylglutaryl-CoA lyase, partial [Pseudomonadota bacterium]
RRLAEVKPDEIALADTIGVAVPDEVSHLLRQVGAAVGPDVPLRVHFHNTRNTGIANADAAVKAGVTRIDASIGGIGGCPFAPRATGNIATEDLLYLLGRSGRKPPVDLEATIAVAHWLESHLGHQVPGLVNRAGPFPG